ncbi:MAG: type II toxin-antitoxin system RelE/ParE family toxin [Lysobacterales bacterium]
MGWEVEYTDEFEAWWQQDLSEGEQDEIAAVVGLLERKGPHLRELRMQYRGNPYRILYAFDPRRIAVLLIGGCKTGRDRWYEEFVPLADTLYDEHLNQLRKEGLIP